MNDNSIEFGKLFKSLHGEVDITFLAAEVLHQADSADDVGAFFEVFFHVVVEVAGAGLPGFTSAFGLDNQITIQVNPVALAGEGGDSEHRVIEVLEFECFLGEKNLTRLFHILLCPIFRAWIPVGAELADGIGVLFPSVFSGVEVLLEPAIETEADTETETGPPER